MAATVEIDEVNGVVTGTRTHAVANSNYGSNDSQALDPVVYPITPGANAYEKWQQWDVTAMGGSAAVKNLKYYNGGSVAANTSHLFNGHTTQGTYDTLKKTTYEQPLNTNTKATQAVPTSAPGSPNIGIAGSLTGSLSGTGQSDFVVSQITTTGSATAGATLTITFRYDEIA